MYCENIGRSSDSFYSRGYPNSGDALDGSTVRGGPRPREIPKKPTLKRSLGFPKAPKIAPPRVIPEEEKEKLIRNLTPIQHRVTQDKVTERPFSNQFYKHFERGTYACVVCREPIFSSSSKYDSKSGWPAFYDIIDKNKVSYKQDLSHVGANLLLLVCNPSIARTEVSCAVCSAHLGHVFDDGPRPTGTRFCVNSSSLSFVPSDQEGLKRGKEGDDLSEKRKKTNEDDQEPLIHLASPANSCSVDSQICFRVPNVDSCRPPTLS